MQLNYSTSSTRMVVVGIVFLSLLQISVAQLVLASPPIVADPAEKRFQGVKEDWTSPALNTSTLKMGATLAGYVNDHPGYTVELLQVQWRFGDPIDLYVMKPKAVSKPPVILYLYSFPSETDRFKNENFQAGATKDGFAAVGFVSALTGHRYHDRPMREWFVSELQESLATSAHDVQMVLNYLATRGDLDMNRVGMFALGSGASIGILTSAVDPRIKVLDTLNPWGDWPAWMSHSPLIPENERAKYVRPQYLKKVAVLEPVKWLPKVQAKKFRLQDAVFDVNTPKVAKGELRAAASAEATVVVYQTLQDFNLVVNGNRELEWIKRELRSLPDTRAESSPAM